MVFLTCVYACMTLYVCGSTTVATRVTTTTGATLAIHPPSHTCRTWLLATEDSILATGMCLFINPLNPCERVRFLQCFFEPGPPYIPCFEFAHVSNVRVCTMVWTKGVSYPTRDVNEPFSFETETRPRHLKVCSRWPLPRFFPRRDRDVFRDVANGTAC